MSILRVLSIQGDTTYEWDQERALADDPEAVAAVREAERIFIEHRRQGATAFKVEPGQAAERLDEFDPSAKHVIVVPRVAGG